MKELISILLILFSVVQSSAQAFVNGEVDGPIGSPSLPPSWNDVPDTDPASNALAPIQATSDVLDATGPNVMGGIAATPFSGSSCVSGLQASSGGGFYWHEGIMQTVNGFTVGTDYTICFYQAVIQQQNATDTSGSWRVYADNTLLGTTAISITNLAFNDVNVNWELRSVTFTATAATHTIKFLPWDDDANASTLVGMDGALRMGIDLISFGPPPPDPTITAAGPFCTTAAPVTLSAVDPGGTWSGTGITNPSTGEFDPSVAGIGTHTVYYTIPSGCAGTTIDSTTIDVSSSSSALWTNPGALCESDAPIDLNTYLSGTAGGNWSGTGVSGTMFDPSGLSGNISVTYQVGTAPCDSSMTQDINVIASPDASWNPPASLCESDPIVDLNTLIAGSAGGTWSGTGVSGSDFDPSVGTQSITYTVGSGSCQDVSTQTITVNASGDASWTAPVGMCESDAPIDLNTLVTGSSGGSWSGTGVTGSLFDPAGLNGNISITYTLSGNCAGTSTQDIPVLSLGSSISGTDISCFGDANGTANVTPSGGLNYTYNWSNGANTQNISNLVAGTYTVTITETNTGCTTTNSLIISEPPNLEAVASSDPVCTGLGSATVAVTGGVGPYTYAWVPNGETTPTITGLTEGAYGVDVTDANGCTTSSDVNVVNGSAPILSIIEDTIINVGQEVMIEVEGADVYAWDETSVGLDCYDCEDPFASPQVTTQYCVTGSTNGCSDTACVRIFVNYDCSEPFVPSAFSPNDDGENDILCVYSTCLSTISFKVYNRWGEKVFESGDQTICWDGTWKGKELNSAVFVYVLEGWTPYGEQVHKKGNISLIR